MLINSHVSQRLPPRKRYGVATNAARWWLELLHGRICLRDKRRGNRVVARWHGKVGLAGAEVFAMLVRRLRLRAPQNAYVMQQLRALDIALDYSKKRELPVVPEPHHLVSAGTDRFQRTIWLHPDARTAWLAMQAAALKAGVHFEIVSAFRSQRYQADLLKRKLKRGEPIADILSVSAAPGFSEHHSGCAIDLAEPGAVPLVEAFAESAAFLWLQENALRFRFIMSFPPENQHGVLYEPWHWCYHPRNTRRSSVPQA